MANMSADEAIESVLATHFQIETIKPEQRQILDALLAKKDCMVVLPTGFGKSLPYQMLIPTKREMGVDDGMKVVVSSPLTALMQDQCDRLSKIPGIKAIYKGGCSQTDEDIESGSFDFLFASPETLVGDQKWRVALQQFEVSTIVVDEFHTIATWGEDEGDSKKAFRKWFSCIGELRSLHPRASVLALSATCTQKISNRVKKILNLNSDNLVDIRISPNRENIKIVVNKVANNTEMAMSWVVNGLQDGLFPKTLIYCMSIKDAANIYTYILQEIPDCKCIDMFHSETEDVSKSRIMDSLKNPNSDLKIVVATNALGMGIDIKNFYNVVLYGCPKSIVDLVQEIGRVGRDGKNATAMLLHNSYHLRGVDSDVKAVYTKSADSDCRRATMLTPFLSTAELSDLAKKERDHSCCDLCNSICSCETCARTHIETLFHFVSDGSDESEMSESEAVPDVHVSDFEDELFKSR